MPRRIVYVRDIQYNLADKEPVVFAHERFDSLQAAWRFFEGDLLLSKECSKTYLHKGKHGVIEAIIHEDRRGAHRPCKACGFAESTRKRRLARG